jgi:hypothetical protein
MGSDGGAGEKLRAAAAAEAGEAVAGAIEGRSKVEMAVRPALALVPAAAAAAF